jgi:flagellar protein FliL
MVIGLLLLALSVGGGSAWFVQQRDRTAEADRAVDNSAAPKYIVRLEGFTVNLADPEDTHFLRATIDLGVDHLPENSDTQKPAQSLPVPRIRDAILSVLTLCKADELLTPEGKVKLKKNLIEALNKSVPELGVREIYFTEFLVQR